MVISAFVTIVIKSIVSGVAVITIIKNADATMWAKIQIIVG